MFLMKLSLIHICLGSYAIEFIKTLTRISYYVGFFYGGRGNTVDTPCLAVEKDERLNFAMKYFFQFIESGNSNLRAMTLLYNHKSTYLIRTPNGRLD